MAIPVVLLVDDDPVTRRLYSMALEKAGFFVIVGDGPDAALETVAGTSDIAAIVVDAVMPPGSRWSTAEAAGGFRTGILLCRHLRSLLPEVPLMLLSSMDAASLRHYPTQGLAVIPPSREEVSPVELARYLSATLKP
jgi:CheY-like chemotaxis protein